MSPTNSTEENWLLFQTKYDYMALPASLAVEVLKHMKIVSKSGSKIELASGECTVQVVSNEQMTVALVKAKLLPKEEKED